MMSKAVKVQHWQRKRNKNCIFYQIKFVTDLWVVALHIAFSLVQSILLPHNGCTSGALSRKFSCQIAPAVLQKACCSLLFLPKLSVLLVFMLPFNKGQSFLHIWGYGVVPLMSAVYSGCFFLKGFGRCLWHWVTTITINATNTEDIKLGDAEIILANWK